MDCEICGRQTYILVILPIRREGGAIKTFACEECSKVSGSYCLLHEMPHDGYEDDTSLCHKCLNELIDREDINAHEYLKMITAGLSGDNLDDLNDWLDLVGVLMRGRARGLLRALAIRSLRYGSDIPFVVKKIIEDRTAYSILPEMFR